MNIAKTKQRILEYVDYKGIKISNFLAETEIKRGFLDADKLNATVTDVFLAKIIETYPDLNLYWLVSGKGGMLIDPTIPSKYDERLEEIKSLPKSEQERIFSVMDDLIKVAKDRQSVLTVMSKNE